MNEFKVGDWVRAIDGTDISIIGIDTIRWYEEIEDKDIANEWELWQPKVGEWCHFIIKNTKFSVVAKFKEKENGKFYCYLDETVLLDIPFDYCEPFISELPSFLKDNQ